ncbi:hypothetical protein AB9F29_14175 [Falsihalocynthiibacter sp. S25ZX9]|uniref:Uncharacterized protein n=1 Tax=Falsihalocynthiibacter arcticus TaxID=1579316 RepID=A0A126V2G2_9RHOB|nr:hypothetical protein [Falsihalocynthiibacter arcticus]AML52504.1 hypothetical protein RC74_15590 [Falsihalocynthiibacter arcticus]
MTDARFDPKGLIKDCFSMDGITDAECRSVFVDWALSVPADVDTREALEALNVQYQQGPEGHPMLTVLKESLLEPAVTGRRGGWSGRRTGRT